MTLTNRFPFQRHYSDLTAKTASNEHVHRFIFDFLDWYHDQLENAPKRDGDVWMTGLSALGHRLWRIHCWKGVRRSLHENGYFANFSQPREFGHMTLLNSMVMPLQRVNPADKLLAGQYIPAEYRDRVSTAPVVKIFENTNELSLDDVPNGSYFLKSNHASAQVKNLVVDSQRNSIDIQNLRDLTTSWLAMTHGKRSSQWWYRLINRKAYLEQDLRELVEGSSAESFPDLKFHCINGQVAILQHTTDIHSADRDDAIYDGNLNYLPYHFTRPNRKERPLPENVELARDVAAAISKNHQYVRVDLYSAGNRLFLGELTFLPNAGLRRVRSRKLNGYLCDLWDPMPQIVNIK